MSFKEKLKNFVKKYHYTKEEVNLKVSNINNEVSNINSEISTVQTTMNEIQSMYFINIDIDNPIISYVEPGPQTATLTATLYPISKNQTIKIYKNNILVDTQQTDLKGQVSYTYTAEGVGNVEIKFKHSLITLTCNIEDCQYYNDGSHVDGLTFSTDVNCTSNGEYITISDTIRQDVIILPNGITNVNQSWIFETEIAKFDSDSALIIRPTANSKPYIDVYSSDTLNYNITGSQSDERYGVNIKAGDKIKIKWEAPSNMVYFIYNDKIIDVEHMPGFLASLRYVSTNKSQYIKSIKVKKI